MAILTPKLDSVHEMSPRALGELKAWLEPWFLNQNKCCATAPEPLAPFSEAIATLAATRDLRGYWRLGEGGLGPYADTSGYSGGPSDMARVDGTVDMSDLTTGALPADDDDGAVQFNDSTGVIAVSGGSDHLEAGAAAPFEGPTGDPLTIMGWVKPFASGSTFDGGIFSTLAYSAGNFGSCLGVEWPMRTLFFHTKTTRLSGPTLAADEWVFACAVHDATSNRLYLNGALVATGASVDATQSGGIKPKIGLWNHSSGSGGNGPGTLYGAVDEVSLWADALTDAEIALLAASGGLAEDSTVRSVINTVAAYTANPNETVLANGTFTVTLPTAVGNSSAEVVVKNTGVGTITVAQDGSEMIDGSTTDLTLATMEAVVLVSDGSNWFAIGAYP